MSQDGLLRVDAACKWCGHGATWPYTSYFTERHVSPVGEAIVSAYVFCPRCGNKHRLEAPEGDPSSSTV